MTRPTPIKAFVNTPISRLVCGVTLLLPFVVSLMDLKYLFELRYDPAITQWHQYWRMASFQIAFNQESDVLLGLLLWYHFKVVERLYGSHKYLTLITLAFLYNGALTIVLLLVSYMLTGTAFPPSVASGPLALLFSVLAVYRTKIPTTYHFTVQLSSKLHFTDKSFIYLFALQLFWNNGWASMVPCMVGTLVGEGLLLGALPGLDSWRIPLMKTFGSGGVLARDSLQEPDDGAEPVRPLTTQLLDTFRP